MCLSHSHLCQVVVSGSKSNGLDTFKMCPDVNMGRSRTTATLRIQKRTRVAPRNIANHKNEQEVHHSNIMKWQTSESCTTATLWITKRTRASPRQDCELKNEQELHHSNATKHNTSESCTTATLRINKEQNGWTPYQFARSGSLFKHTLNLCRVYLKQLCVLVLWELPQTIGTCIESLLYFDVHSLLEEPEHLSGGFLKVLDWMPRFTFI